jgi:hypothetical protein
LADVLLGFHHAVDQRALVGLVGVVNLRREDQLAVEVDRVLGLVRQVRAAVLPLGDPRIGIGRALPVVIGDLLGLPFLVEAANLRVGRLLVLLDDAFIRPTTYARQSSPVSVRTMLFIAALASRVVESTPTVFPLRRPFSSASFKTNWNAET